jgi:hypothetical protein
MPYKDPEKQKAYNREYKRRQRLAKKKDTKSQTPVQLFRREESEFRIKTANDILELLADTIRQVRSLEFTEPKDTLGKTRTIGYLAQIALRAVETANLEGRIEALETVLKTRKENVA